VNEWLMSGAWPTPDGPARAALAAALADLPDEALVVIDGLIGSAVPEVLVPEAGRLRLVLLVHMPLGIASNDQGVLERERRTLQAAKAIVATSEWTRQWLIQTYALPAVQVVTPGVSAAGVAAGSPNGAELLCVAAVTPGKGHDVLLEALATLTDLPWQCACVGSREVAPGFAEDLVRRADRDRIGDRVRFTGPLVGADLDRAFAAADVLVLPSRAETYAMVVTEALARGIPVIASDVGGVPEALGDGVGHGRPGLLVAPGEPQGLATALRWWLVDGDLREQLRSAALRRRASLTDWSVTAEQISWVLKESA
jgi:glycosyltransferase involved in cell wall biosynthesis